MVNTSNCLRTELKEKKEEFKMLEAICFNSGQGPFHMSFPLPWNSSRQKKSKELKNSGGKNYARYEQSALNKEENILSTVCSILLIRFGVM